MPSQTGPPATPTMYYSITQRLVLCAGEVERENSHRRHTWPPEQPNAMCSALPLLQVVSSGIATPGRSLCSKKENFFQPKPIAMGELPIKNRIRHKRGHTASIWLCNITPRMTQGSQQYKGVPLDCCADSGTQSEPKTSKKHHHYCLWLRLVLIESSNVHTMLNVLSYDRLSTALEQRLSRCISRQQRLVKLLCCPAANARCCTVGHMGTGHFRHMPPCMQPECRFCNAEYHLIETRGFYFDKEHICEW